MKIYARIIRHQDLKWHWDIWNSDPNEEDQSAGSSLNGYETAHLARKALRTLINGIKSTNEIHILTANKDRKYINERSPAGNPN